jgi:hypothetical protein
MHIGLIILVVFPIVLLICWLNVLHLRQEDFPNWTPSEFKLWRTYRLWGIRFKLLFCLNGLMFLVSLAFGYAWTNSPDFLVVDALVVGTILLCVGQLFTDKAKKIAIIVQNRNNQSMPK